MRAESRGAAAAGMIGDSVFGRWRMLLLIGFFLAVALAGTFFAIHLLRGHKLPLPVGLLHGLGALAAIALLVLHDLHAPTNRLVNSATVFFVLTAIGGMLLFVLRARRQPLDGIIVTLHAGFALTAMLLLTLGYLSG